MADLEDVTLDGKPLHSLRVADLKAALEQRGLPKSGQKNALIKRLKGALMLENLQRTSTPHIGLQPNSQIGEEMSQNSFIKQYLAKQQELLRQRLEREAREAAEADDSVVVPEEEDHAEGNGSTSCTPEQRVSAPLHPPLAEGGGRGVGASEAGAAGEEGTAAQQPVSFPQSSALTASQQHALSGQKEARPASWGGPAPSPLTLESGPREAPEAPAGVAPPRAVASLSVRVLTGLSLPRPSEQEGATPTAPGPAHSGLQLSQSAQPASRAREDSDEDDDDDDSDEEWGVGQRRGVRVQPVWERSRRKQQPPQHIPPQLQLREPTPPPSPPLEPSFPLPDTPKQSPPGPDAPEGGAAGVAEGGAASGSAPALQRLDSTSSSDSSPEPPQDRRPGPLSLLARKMESEGAFAPPRRKARPEAPPSPQKQPCTGAQDAEGEAGRGAPETAPPAGAAQRSTAESGLPPWKRSREMEREESQAPPEPAAVPLSPQPTKSPQKSHFLQDTPPSAPPTAASASRSPVARRLHSATPPPEGEAGPPAEPQQADAGVPPPDTEGAGVAVETTPAEEARPRPAAVVLPPSPPPEEGDAERPSSSSTDSSSSDSDSASSSGSSSSSGDKGRAAPSSRRGGSPDASAGPARKRRGEQEQEEGGASHRKKPCRERGGEERTHPARYHRSPNRRPNQSPSPGHSSAAAPGPAARSGPEPNNMLSDSNKSGVGKQVSSAMEVEGSPESESRPEGQAAPESSEGGLEESTTPKAFAARKISLTTASKPPPGGGAGSMGASPPGTQGEAESGGPAGRKRRWGSSTAVTAKKPSISITTDSLKSLIPDMKPGAGSQEAVVELHPEEARLSGDEEVPERGEGGEPGLESGLKIRRTVTQVVPAEGQENGQKEQEEEEEEVRGGRPVSLKEESKDSCAEVAMETHAPAAHEGDGKKVTPSDTLVRRSISQQKAGVSVTIDDPVRTAKQPSPPRGKVTNIVHVCHLVRPFTLGQLKELLNRTGTVLEEGFWIDKIKSHCYVTYSTTEEAVATRNALHGVKWPQSNPKVLSVDFCEQDELDFHRGLLSGDGGVEEDGAGVAGGPGGKPPPLLPERDLWAQREREMERRERARAEREWDRDKVRDFGKPGEDREGGARRSRSRDRERRRKERGKSKERKTDKKEKAPEEPPAKLLDDLFCKTKTAPCIYWLPLSEEQARQREAERAERMKERERRRKEQQEEEERKREEERRERAKGREKEAGGAEGERERERERERAREREGDKRRDSHRARGAESRPAGGAGGGARRSRSRSTPPPRDRRR
ncbi:apoptotic chromatin condensation inducer 1b [Megalops cyprinoides]|uniref:apoptotic chromatin condensation inducer 1b n=1 Tax=Megalops cyprinoides TaxID=118141 RepID=UPI0018641179|nr:apoptotic chromatin condensation inducer 1b [Megalops cyprinoides]